MDSVRPKLSEVAGENDDTTQSEDDLRRHVQSAEEEDEVVPPGFRSHQMVEKLPEFYPRRKAKKKPMNAPLFFFYPWEEDFSRPGELIGKSQLKCPRCKSRNTKFFLLGVTCYKYNYRRPLDLNHQSVPFYMTICYFLFYYFISNQWGGLSGKKKKNQLGGVCLEDCSRSSISSPRSRPRHFCKSCRRHFTEGGTPRNIPSFSATSFASNCSSSAASTSKNERENSNNRGKIALKDPNTVGCDYKEWYNHYRTGTKYRDVGPNSVTGSGFWEPTGTKTPTYYSDATPSGPNYTSIFASMDNHPQPSEPPSNQHPARPEVRIDIFDGNTDLLIHQSWKEYKDHLKNSQSDDDAMKIMSGTLTAVAGQVIGGVMVYKITAPYSWAGSAVEIATVLGLCVTLAGISLRGRSRAHSALVIKIGAVITASAIVFSMGLHLPPAMAMTVGPVMFLIMAVAAAFA